MMKRQIHSLGTFLIGVAMAIVGLSGVALAFAMSATSAHALSLTPATFDWQTPVNGNFPIASVQALTDLTGLTEVLKKDVGPAAETGSFAGSYTIAFQDSSTDPAGFTITYNSGAVISCGTCLLEVKDGTQEPARYFFNLSATGIDGNFASSANTPWNGIDLITGTLFWPAQGAISHVTIYNVPGTSVPEPASLMLLGAGLAGIGIWRRKAAN